MAMVSMELAKKVVEILLRDGEIKVTTNDLERNGASIGGLIEAALLLGGPLTVELCLGRLLMARGKSNIPDSLTKFFQDHPDTARLARKELKLK